MFVVYKEVREAGMGTDSTRVYAEEVAENLQSDLQRDRKESEGRSTRGAVLCNISCIDSFGLSVIFRSLMLCQPSDDRDSKNAGDLNLDLFMN